MFGCRKKTKIGNEYTLTFYEDGVPSTINLNECSPLVMCNNNEQNGTEVVDKLLDRLMQEYEDDSSIMVFYLAKNSKEALRVRSLTYTSSLYVEVFDCSSNNDVKDFIRLYISEESIIDLNSQMKVFIAGDLQEMQDKMTDNQFCEILDFFSSETSERLTCRIMVSTPEILLKKMPTGTSTLLLCEG